MCMLRSHHSNAMGGTLHHRGASLLSSQLVVGHACAPCSSPCSLCTARPVCACGALSVLLVLITTSSSCGWTRVVPSPHHHSLGTLMCCVPVLSSDLSVLMLLLGTAPPYVVMLWVRCYVGPSLCCYVVGPDYMDPLRLGGPDMVPIGWVLGWVGLGWGCFLRMRI